MFAPLVRQKGTNRCQFGLNLCILAKVATSVSGRLSKESALNWREAVREPFSLGDLEIFRSFFKYILRIADGGTRKGISIFWKCVNRKTKISPLRGKANGHQDRRDYRGPESHLREVFPALGLYAPVLPSLPTQTDLGLNA